MSTARGEFLTDIETLRRRAREHIEANEEQGHADQVAERITQLGGAPDLNPQGLASKSHSEYVEGEASWT